MLELELGQWGDGTIRLAFWDSLHGADVFFVLSAGGKAYRAGDEQEDGSEVLTEVDLVEVLRAMAVTPPV
jgi:hypothetical protein